MFVVPNRITRATYFPYTTLFRSYSGNAFSTMSEGLDMSAEIIGLIVAGVVLLITFGSMVAAGMPLISAVIGVGVGLLGVQLATVFTDSVAEMTPMLVSMIVLAVGIAYA